LIPALSMKDRTAAVLGLGRSGLSACRALQAGGARVWAWDDALPRRIEAADAGVPIVDLAICNWARIDRLVLSPGIPLTHPRPHPIVRQARAAGVAITGDVELMVENEPGRLIVGVTGTNGKSTTTALAAHLLRAAGRAAQAGGNIGSPVLDLLPNTPENIYVLELSSYQLELTERLRCTVAVLLNLSPDHLDRHGGMTGYVRAKRRILHNQKANDWAILGVDDDHGQKLLAAMTRRSGQRLLPVAVGSRVEGGVFAIDGRLYDAIDGAPIEVADLRGIPTLQGAHNWQNAAAAYATTRALGVAPEAAAAGLGSFAGLAHRMEPVATIEGVRFVNDSKATNPDAAARALASFQEIYWIAGGRPKEGGLEPVLPWLSRVRNAFLIGEAAEAFGRTLRAQDVRHTVCGELATAVRQAAEAARRDAREGSVVLFSPACASFDQFRDFEHRGEVFKRLVAELRQPEPALAGGGHP
jgi:UDP-N-acetylmuramoylalanine--D-glutamate ligase